MDEKWIFLLIMNRDNNEKICQHLIEMEKLSLTPMPTPLQYSIAMEILQENRNFGNISNVCSNGQRDANSSIRK